MKRRHWLWWAGSVAVATILTGAGTTGCGGVPDEPPCADVAPFRLGADTYEDVGKPGQNKGTGRPFVIVLDEQHASRVGQVEIAMMLNRLYHKAGLRHLALEGSVVDDPAPDLSWFTSMPDAEVREAVALQMLKQGEVSAAEFAAMVLPGFQLHSIERDDEYQVDMSDAAGRSYTGYLVAIAVATMTDDQYAQASALLDQDKAEEAIRFMVDTSPWTHERYEFLERETPVPTTGEMQKLALELEAKADEVNADVTGYRAELQEAQKFFDTAARRSRTMTEKTAEVATARTGDCAPIAMNIGAAHTDEVTELLGQRDMSYAVVSPSDLSLGSDNGSLSTEAYDRKLNGQSVDPAGGFGALVDGRRKPPPSSQQEWYKAKAQLTYATVEIARTVAAGDDDEPPFNLDQKQLGLGGSGPDAPRIAVDLSTVRVVPVADDPTRRDVTFKVTLLKDNTIFWVKAGVVAPADRGFSPDGRTLEQALVKVRDELRKEPPTDGPKPTEQRPFDVTGDVKSAIAKTEAEVAAINLI